MNGSTSTTRTGDTEGDGHRHLAVVAARPPWDRARWLVVALAVAAVAAFAASYFLPWWSFVLYAPQYPSGLRLVISLTGMSGDVREIDTLNHYIGMAHLEGAAPTERQLAGYGVAAVAVITFAIALAAGRKLNRALAIPALAFPIGFLGDSFYWLYTFGHRLDPKAPIRLGAFTPQLFGNGQIGQFETYAEPSFGFWMAAAGVAAMIAAALVRARVCAHCGHAATCSAVCPRLLVLPERRS
ncbi:MAG: hypothetical protein QM820_22485 [Minicystis sp.]